MGKSMFVFGAILAPLAALAFLLIIYTTPCGLGISPDSVVYIGAALNFLDHNDFQANGEALTRFPPAYPFVIAVTDFLAGDIVQSVRFLHAFLFAINVILIGLMGRVVTKSNYAGTLCAVLFVTCANMLDVHNMAWSEPLFISFSVSAYMLVIIYVSDQRFFILMGSALFLSLALMTRYAGIALLPPIIIFLLAFDSVKATKRLRDSLVLFSIALGPIVMWLVRNIAIAGSATSRSIAFHPISFRHLQILDKTISGFWFPESDLYWLKLIKTAIITGLFVYALIAFLRVRLQSGNLGNDMAFPILWLFLFLCIAYIAFLLFSISFLDATTPLDYRILSPFHAFSLVLVVSVYWYLGIKKSFPVFWKFFLAVSFVGICLNVFRLALLIPEWHKDGRWFAARQWKDSECIAYARSLPEQTRIYSDGPFLINFLTGRNSQMLPKTVNAIIQCPNKDFDKEMDAIRDEVVRGEAVIIYFNDITFRLYVAQKEDVKLPASIIFKDGIIYAAGAKDKVVEPVSP